jgi:hypothetical protein
MSGVWFEHVTILIDVEPSALGAQSGHLGSPQSPSSIPATSLIALPVRAFDALKRN